jgi:rhodanese-related sulfurtransferase
LLDTNMTTDLDRPDAARPLSTSTAGKPRRQWLAWLGATAATAGLAGCDRSDAATDAVGLEVARSELEAGRVVLIDIREPEEHATGVAAGARLLPMRQLSRRLAEIPGDPRQPVLLICNTQNRSSATLRALRERGYGHVRYVNGGMSEWARRGWPMVKPVTGQGS